MSTSQQLHFDAIVCDGHCDTLGDVLAGRYGLAQAPVVVANILAPVIIQLLRDDGLLDYVAPDGRLILSGIILEQGPAVEGAIAEAGGQVIRTITTGDWVTYIAGPR